MDDYLEWMRSHLLPLVKRRKLAAFAAIRCGGDGFSAEQAQAYLRTARQMGFGVRVEANPASVSEAINVATELNASSASIMSPIPASKIWRASRNRPSWPLFCREPSFIWERDAMLQPGA